MQIKRVVVTGMGAVSPFGRGVGLLMDSLDAGRSAVQSFPDLGDIGGLRSHVGAKVEGIDPKEIPRKFRRSMSDMSIFATLACYEALESAGLSLDDCTGPEMGVVIGSTIGSTQTTQDFFEDFLTDHSLERMKSTVFFKIMNHSCASNVAQALGIKGRILSPSSACSTGCQAIGYGFEMIALGKQQRMLCGGADEFHPLTVATFDVMHAASTRYNASPGCTPRPFDLDRDGVVCAEGSGIVLLESLESAQSRGAEILAEVIGFATVSDPSNIANPNADAMERCMRLALEDAGVDPGQIGYINAHATATEQGDIAESEAIARIFGNRTPVSSLKGHMGHTMAASGSLETVATIAMMRSGRLIPTLNLQRIDPSCAGILHVAKDHKVTIDLALKNNFAMGGVNSSLVLRRYKND